MQRHEIAPDEWPEFFDAFNGQHEGCVVGLDRFDEFLDETIETRHLDGTLRGVRSAAGDVALAVEDASSGQVETETIRNPQRVVLEQSEDEMDTALEIDAAQSCIILRFTDPMSIDQVEMLDGIAG